MRNSRNTFQTNPADKTVYPKCNLKKDHENQSLNLVCLTKTCKLNGPICALCKKEHTGHTVVPIKNFISTTIEAHKKLVIQAKKLEQISVIEEQVQKRGSWGIECIQQSFKQIMGMLNFQVYQLSEIIKKTEVKMIQDYEQAKLAFQEQNAKGEIIGECIEYMNGKKYSDKNEFRRNISAILKHLNLTKNDIQLHSKEEDIVNNYKTKAQTYKSNLFLIQTQIKQLYSFIHEKSMKDKIQKIEKCLDNRPKTAHISNSKADNLNFSPTLKSSNIILEKQGKCARLKDNNGTKVVFIQNGISAKTYQATFKILNLVGNISVGLGLKDKLKQKSFRFEKTTPGHGAFMIVSNTFKYNHYEKTEDATSSSFTFGNGDEILISFKAKEKKLVFQLKNDKQKTSEISLKSLPEAALKDLQFCVAFTAAGDKVEII